MNKSEIVGRIIQCFKEGKKLFICGNGGSAAMAQHMAGEFVSKFEYVRRALPAISLTTDTSIITSIANDFGYENVFKRQLEALAKPGDLLIVFSTSGKSPSCLRAIEWAKNNDVYVIEWARDMGEGTPEIQEYQLVEMHEVVREVEKAFL